MSNTNLLNLMRHISDSKSNDFDDDVANKYDEKDKFVDNLTKFTEFIIQSNIRGKFDDPKPDNPYETTFHYSTNINNDSMDKSVKISPISDINECIKEVKDSCFI